MPGNSSSIAVNNITCASLTASSEISAPGGGFTSLIATNATVTNNLDVAGQVSLYPGSPVVFGNAETITDLPLSAAYGIPGLTDVTQYGNYPNSTQHSRLAIQGQFWAHKNRVGSVNDWTQAPIITGRTNEQESALGFAGLDESGVGAAWVIQVNSAESSLGFMHRNGAGNYCPVTASNFVTASSARFKDDIQNLESGLDAVRNLRPISFTKDHTGHYVAVTPEGQPLKKSHPDYAKSIAKQAKLVSKGDTKARASRNLGLIAEEVARIVPEVVSYDPSGRPEGIDYTALVPVLVNAIKELAERVDGLHSAVTGT
jgi:hypothetical protein